MFLWIKKLAGFIYEWLQSKDAILIILLAIVINRFTSWLPEYYYISPFPFYRILDEHGVEIGITLQSYYYILCWHFLMFAFWQYCMIKNRLSTRQMFYAFRAIEIASLFDFFLIYEHPWFYVGTYGVEFTDFKVFLYLIFYAKWSRYQHQYT